MCAGYPYASHGHRTPIFSNCRSPHPGLASGLAAIVVRSGDRRVLRADGMRRALRAQATGAGIQRRASAPLAGDPGGPRDPRSPGGTSDPCGARAEHLGPSRASFRLIGSGASSCANAAGRPPHGMASVLCHG